MWEWIIIILALLFIGTRHENHFKVGGPQPLGPRVITLYAVGWCHYCRNMKPVWDRVKAHVPSDAQITFVELDGDKVKDPTVTSYPTIVMNYNGYNCRYQGEANYDKLYNWVMSTRPQC